VKALDRWNKSIPEGMTDLLFGFGCLKADLENDCVESFRVRGFSPLETPTLEYYDVFDGVPGGLDQTEMYKLFDADGRILVMRPDLTIPMARVTATRLAGAVFPLRFCYRGQVFRTRQNFGGMRHEWTQCGAEIIGGDSGRADLDCLEAAVSVLLESGASQPKLELGQADFFKGVAEELNLDEAETELIRGYIEKKSFGNVQDYLKNREKPLSSSEMETLMSLPWLFGGPEVLAKARTHTRRPKATAALDQLESLYSELCRMGLGEYLSFDLGMVHQLGYYTGIIFRGYVKGAGDYVLSGGRYDRLLSQFGMDRAAVGFGVNVDLLAQAIGEVEKKDRMAARYLLWGDWKALEQVYALAEILRKRGCPAEISLSADLDEARSCAAARQIPYVLAWEEGAWRRIDAQSGERRPFQPFNKEARNEAQNETQKEAQKEARKEDRQ
jgi:ATP phosphoribosyltransferase regulatory subunit